MSQSRVFLAAFLGTAAVFGFWHYQEEKSAYAENEIQEFTDSSQRVQFAAQIVKDPEETHTGKRVVVDPEFASNGRVLLFVDSFMEVAYGDRIEVTGLLQNPGTFNDFNYADFLLKDGVYAVMYQPVVRVQETKAYENMVQSGLGKILFVKAKFREVLHKHLSPPESTILAALLLGDKNLLSEETKKKLNRAGVRHITAISGMHVAVLTIYLMPFLIFLGLWRQQAFYVTLAIMIFFVVLTGLQASAVRAGVMGGMFLLAQHIGRINMAPRALVLVGAVMLMFNPFLLTRDVGFQLSFLAVYGIILFLPIFLALAPKKLLFREIIGMSLAAQIFTLPILVFNFGQISLVSVVANILIVPLLPFVMGFGFLFLLGGLFGETFGFLFSVPVSLLLAYISFIVDIFAKLPFAAVKTENFSAFWLVPFYLVFGFFYWKFRKKEEFLV